MLLFTEVFVVCFLSSVFSLTDVEIKSFSARTHKEKNTGLQGTVSITVSQNDPNVLELRSNGIPDHPTGTFNGNPNYIASQSFAFQIPKNPVRASSTTCLPQGPVAMAINGVAIMNPYSRECCDTGQEELDLFDSCAGHPSPQSTYHYHVNPSCLYTHECNKSSGIIGVAFDGFPIYGPNDENGIQLTKSDLDECNGKVTNDQYRYHLTSTFPYIMGCFRGSVRSDAGIRISSTCKCTRPANPCTEFNNRPQGRRKRQTSSLLSIECCVKENCTQPREDDSSSTHQKASFITVLMGSFLLMSINRCLL